METDLLNNLKEEPAADAGEPCDCGNSSSTAEPCESGKSSDSADPCDCGNSVENPCGDFTFRTLEAEDLKQLACFYNLRPNRASDSVPLESFLWRDYYNARVALTRRNGVAVGLLWLYGTEEDPAAGMPLCREEDLRFCFLEIQCYFNRVLKKPLLIKLADEEAVRALNLDPEKYLIQEEEDFKDYLYDGDALRSLSGKKLHKKKNHYNSFVKFYGDRWLYRALTPADRDEVFRFLDKWRENKGEVVEQHLDPEVQGIHNILKNLDQIDAKMGGVFIDGKLEAFSIGSLNAAENMAVIHIEKANPEINGLYQVINREFLTHEFPDAALVNREDDVGIEGLRQAKLSYFPSGYERKYLVRQKWEPGTEQ